MRNFLGHHWNQSVRTALIWMEQTSHINRWCRLALTVAVCLAVSACAKSTNSVSLQAAQFEPAAGPADYAEQQDGPFVVAAVQPQFLQSGKARSIVPFNGPYVPGTVVVDTEARALFLVNADGTALRYAIGVGREGFQWSGEATIGRKQQWPAWTPPAEMIARQPDLEPYRGGMPGGPGNPLGARALYLVQDGQDTLFRLHGTREPWSIGKKVSSGCIRLFNQDIIDLYDRVAIGARVVVLGRGST